MVYATLFCIFYTFIILDYQDVVKSKLIVYLLAFLKALSS